MVTPAARGCQPASAETLGAGGGASSVAGTDPQPPVPAELHAAFSPAAPPPPRAPRRSPPADQGPGRAEQRPGQVVPARGHLATAHRAAWVGGRTRVRVTRGGWGEAPGVESRAGRYFLRSRRPTARRLGTALRGHGSSETGLPGVVDGGCREDARRLSERPAAETGAGLNRRALSLLRGDPGKSSLKVKRKRAGWSLPYLMHLLGFPST